MSAPGAADAATSASAHDPLPEALELARGAANAGLGLKLLGGLAVRVLCPDFPPRLRRDQDIDYACLSKERKKVAAYLKDSGCEPDKRFNNLNGDRQMYFTAPSGRPIDVMVDRLVMCHTLDLRPSFARQPHTVDAIDVLLSKLQIVESTPKDLQDVVLLVGDHELGDGADRLDADAVAETLAGDWGFWRTATATLEKARALAGGAAAERLAVLAERIEQRPKSARWKMRARVGDSVRRYQENTEAER